MELIDVTINFYHGKIEWNVIMVKACHIPQWVILCPTKCYRCNIPVLKTWKIQHWSPEGVMNVWLGIFYQALNIYAATFSSSFKFKISFWDLHTALSQQKWWHICIFSPGWNFRSHKINKMIRSQWVSSITKFHYYYLKNNIKQIRKCEMTLPNSPKCTITTITLTKI